MNDCKLIINSVPGLIPFRSKNSSVDLFNVFALFNASLAAFYLLVFCSNIFAIGGTPSNATNTYSEGDTVFTRDSSV